MSEIDTVFDLPDRRAIRPLLSAAFAAFYATALASIALYGHDWHWPVPTRVLSALLLAAAVTWEMSKCRNAWRQYSRDHRTERISHESLQI